MPEEQPVVAVVTPEPTKPEPWIDKVLYNLLGANYLSTLQGFLSFVAYGTGAITTWLSGYIATHPGQKSAWWAGIASTVITVASGAAKWYIGRKQLDAKPLA